MSLRAVVTAGGTVDGAFAEAIGTPVKALAPFRGRTLLDVALDAAWEAGAQGIAVIGGDAVAAHCAGRDGVRVLPADDDGGTNVLRALAAWPGDDLLYLTSDVPFCTGDALRDLVERAGNAAIAMPLAAAAAYEARFPGAPVHTMSLGGERFANGTVFLMRSAAIHGVEHFARRFFAARKSALRMALLLGPGLAVRYLSRRLTVAAIEAKAQRELGVPARAVRGADPGLCYDVDTLDDYRYACSRA